MGLRRSTRVVERVVGWWRQERKDSHTYISGGVAGRLFVHEVTKKGRHGRPAECSPFNPFMQKAGRCARPSDAG